jgi:hypothetical protein
MSRRLQSFSTGDDWTSGHLGTQCNALVLLNGVLGEPLEQLGESRTGGGRNPDVGMCRDQWRLVGRLHTHE